MNRTERLAIWQDLLAKAQSRLASVDADYPCADAGLLARIRAGAVNSVETCQGFVNFYSE